MNNLLGIKISELIHVESKFIVILIMAICTSCMKNAEIQSNSFSDYLLIINNLSNQGNWKEAISLANILNSHDDVSESDRIRLFTILGNNYRFLEEYEKAEKSFKTAIEYSKPENLSNYLGEAYYGLGDLNYLKWNYFKQDEALNIAKDYLDSSMICAKRNHDLKLESKILYRQGTIFQIQGNKEESKSSFEKGLEISFSISDTVGIIRNDIHKAAELEADGVLDSALFHYNRAYEYAKVINRNYSEAHSLCNLGLFYLDREQISKSKDYFNKAKFLSEELKHRIVLCRSYYGLSIIEEKLGNQSEAMKYANDGLKLAKEKGYKNYEQAFTNLIESFDKN